MTSKVLILGSEGLVGNYLSEYLILRDYEVTRYDVKLGQDQDLRYADITDLCEANDFVFFLAFDVGGSKYLLEKQNSKSYLDNNMRIILNTFYCLERSGTPFLHTTSQMQNMPDSAYGTLKNIADFYTKSLNGINLRLWNVYGCEPIGEKSHVIPDMIHMVLNNGKITLNSTGTEMREFIHGHDLAKLLEKFMINYDDHAGSNVDCPGLHNSSIKNVARIVLSLHGLDSDHLYVRAESDHVNIQSKFNQPDILDSRFLYTELVKTFFSLEDGIEDIYNRQKRLLNDQSYNPYIYNQGVNSSNSFNFKQLKLPIKTVNIEKYKEYRL